MPGFGWFTFLLFFSDYNIGEDIIGGDDEIEIGLYLFHVGGNIIALPPGHTLRKQPIAPTLITRTLIPSIGNIAISPIRG